MARAHGSGAGEARASALWGTGNRGGEHRSSALWGSGNRGGDSRSNALWGKRGKGSVLVVAALALALPLSAAAGSSASKAKSYVAPGVYQAAAKGEKVRVIIQSSGGLEGAKKANNGLGELKKELKLIGAVVADVSPGRLKRLTEIEGLTITLDAPMKATGFANGGFSSTQLWPHENGVSKLWDSALAAPTIAVIDSGIDTTAGAFGSRVIKRQGFGDTGSGLDGRGHGTFVAGIAAGSMPGYAGASPTSKLVDLDVMDDAGRARTSDVILACEWVLENKGAYGIRVVNMSLHSSSILSIRYHPLNRAVEKLWFGGVVVVAAAGNYGVAGGPSGVPYAPGNDPFVITVGALDIGGTARIGDDGVAPWSAYGYTNEGFSKPEIVASGRYMVAPVPALSTLAKERAEKVLSPGIIQLSGTSFAAPVVAGVAAQILARNPGWTPEMIKGALMKTARRVPDAPAAAQGRGQVNVARAFTVQNVPSGNGPINRFVVPDPQGGFMFAAAAWSDAAWADAAWDSAAWNDAAWTDAAWNDAAWTDAAWNDAAWNDAAWNDAAWADSTTYEDNADDGTSTDLVLTPQDELELASDPDLALPGQTTTTVSSATSPLGIG
jgi:serine protease AprX